MRVTATIHYPDGRHCPLPLWLMIVTADEIAYFQNGGILPFMLRGLAAGAAPRASAKSLTLLYFAKV